MYSIISLLITLILTTIIYEKLKYSFNDVNECKIMEYYMIITAPH